MSNLNSIKKAFDSVEKKSEELCTLNRLVSSIEREDTHKSLFCRNTFVLDHTMEISKESLNALFPIELVAANANQRIKKLETELNDLNVLLDAFDKVMEPVLKEQEQC